MLPIDKKEFWRDRLIAAKQQGDIHNSVYAVSCAKWSNIQNAHAVLLPKILAGFDNPKVLDCGCGYGALLDVMTGKFQYTGVDLSPDLIAEAKQRHPQHTFIEGDLCKLPFTGREFDFAICRSIDGMVKDNLGVGAWRKMEKELLRVADRLVLLSYGEPNVYVIIDAVDDPEVATCNTIAMEGGKLVYRPGMDGTCEIFDLFVDEDCRRMGIATKLVNRLMENTYGSVYSFARSNNDAVRGVYEKLGFDIIAVPGLYRGQDAMMAVKRFDNRKP